ncbi:MAG TPA: hypothetical protein VMM81_07715 [Acidimicrobiia bacterium]|nr:hypothetical protein [Acidimicrobiia bacterium]
MRRVLALTVLLAALTACSGTFADGSRVVLNEYSMVASPRLVAAGIVDFELENVGEQGHMMVITDDDGTVQATTGVIAPGATATLRADLEAGNYFASCRIVVQLPDGQIVDHLEEGMLTTLRVIASDGGS